MYLKMNWLFELMLNRNEWILYTQDLRQYLSTLAEQCNSEETDTELPTVVILDNLHHIGSLSDIFNGFLNCKYHKW